MNLYETGHECSVRKISNTNTDTTTAPVAGTVTTLAGNTVYSCQTYTTSTGTTTGALFNNTPTGLVVDRADDIIVSDTYSIRAIDASGNVTMLAGALCQTQLCTGSDYTSVDGVGSVASVSGSARFSSISAMAIDAKNDVIYVGDFYGTGSDTRILVRKITPDKSSGTNAASWTWTVSTIGNFAYGHVDGPLSAAKFGSIGSITVDTDGTLYIGDSGRYIRRITPDGVVDTIAGDGAVGTYDTTYNTYFVTGPLPGTSVMPIAILLDPTTNQLFFDDSNSAQIHVMPY